ncbi:FtsX-like permease family protein [Epibacterium sp. SM1979]|uniref:FtsX-like permease family protein n=1 Tax=Tritonibacter litoralis TaxID=2662264 RepID=A0A843Y7K5_9RHOB|nr:ABC transporter permease [Tritonibacter litoralis]MQQ07160.1 FtsX-like permease family protein [Tritonibacter litoralis]
MIRWGMLALLSHWRRAPVQFLAIVLGLALSTALWSAVQAINATARASYGEAQTRLALFGADRLMATDRPLLVDDYATLRRAGWLVSPVWEGTVDLGNGPIQLMAIDLLSHPMVPQLQGADQPVSNGTAPLLVETPIFAHPDTLADLGPITYPQQSAPILPRGLVIADLAVAEVLTEGVRNLSHLVVLEANNQTAFPQDLPLEWVKGPNTSPGELTESFHLNLTAFGLLAFVVGLFIVQSTIKLAVEQRRGMMRTLRCLGMPLSTLVTLCAAELLTLAVLAGAIGLCLGYFIAGFLLPGVNATLSGLYGAKVPGQLNMDPSWAATGLAMTLVGTTIAGSSSMIQVYRLPILQSTAASARSLVTHRVNRRNLFISLLLLAIALILLFIPHLLAGFALMGALMLGFVLLLPIGAALVMRFFETRVRPGMAQWIWADMRAQLGVMSVPLMALALAVATNIGVETMTSSFRLTFVNWINQRFSADLYVSVGTADQAQPLLAYLDQNSAETRPLWVSDLESAAHPTRLWGVVDTPYYAERWPMLSETPDGWAKLHQGEGVMVNEQLSRARNLWAGDSISLPKLGDAMILGTYPDYGNPNHQIIMSRDALFQIVPDAVLRNVAVVMGANQELQTELRQVFDLPGTAILDQNQLRAQSLQVFDQTFTVTATLNVLTLGVSGFALLTSFTALWGQRLPQLAPVWAMGLATRQLAVLEVLRSLGLALLTALLAVPLGLLLAWVLLSVTNTLAFGWKLPMFLFPDSWLRTVLLASLAAVIACAPTAWRLYRISPAALLKVFSNER